MLGRLQQHAKTVDLAKCRVSNESQTRQALIDPFVTNIIGYNTANLSEVVVEYDVAPPGAPKQSADYAILRNGTPFLLIEAKAYEQNQKFSADHFKQLKNYVGQTSARFGLLTDGVICKWYRCAPKMSFMEDEPFLIHDVLNPRERDTEWLVAVSKDASEQEELERLAWQLTLEEAIYQWIRSKFVDPTLDDAADLNKAASLGVKKKDLELVREASRVAMNRHLVLPVFPPPPHQPQSTFEHNNRTGDRLDLGDGRFLDAKKLARAWRVNEGDWNEEPNAATVTTKVISWLLEQSTNHDDEDSLAESSRHIATQAELGSRKLKPISDSGHLYVDTNIPNSEKVRLIETVVKWIQSNADQPGNVVKGFSLETWIPTGSPKPKRQKSR